jgi:hypothetical protein
MIRLAGLSLAVLAGTAFLPALPGPGNGSAAFAQCPQINIGTRQNPRYVRDPACGNPSTSGVNAERVRTQFRRDPAERRQARDAERRRREAHSRRR